MKRSLTNLLSASLLSLLILSGFTGKAQQTVLASVERVAKTAKADSAEVANKKADVKPEKKAADAPAWTPVRRLWGYTFGDFYYDAHADATNRGAETMYNGVPADRNAFQFRRIYLGYDYDIDQKFTAELLLASEPNANTTVASATTANVQNGDNLVDNKMAFYIKNINLRYRNIFNGTDLVFGEMSTPGFALNEPGTNAPTSLSEATWAYRAIEKTVTDFHKTNSYDVGVALQGTFDPATKNYGYVFMIGNNSQASLLTAANANTGFFKIFYGDLWAKFLDKRLYVDIYGDYVQTASNTATVNTQSHGVYKIFAAYNAKKFAVGAEAYGEKITNGVANTVTKGNEDATVNALSLWIRGTIIKDEAHPDDPKAAKFGFFARYDTYNPDTQFTTGDTYTVNTNLSSYNPTVKEQFITAGLDFQPSPKIHFEPNVWYVGYKDQRDPSVAGYVADDHTLVYRMTVFFTFGK